MIPYRAAREPSPILLIRLGTALLVLAAAASLVGSPNRGASVPWIGLVAAGAVLVWLAAGGRQDDRGQVPAGGRGVGGDAPRKAARRLSDRMRGMAAARAALAVGYSCLVILPLLTEWPAYKLPALSRVYAAIPSLIPYAPAWLAPGLSPNQTGGVLAACLALAAAFFVRTNRGGPVEPYLRGLRRMAAPLLIVGTPVLLATGSRAALAGLAAAVITGYIVLNPRMAWATAAVVAAAVAISLAAPDLPRGLLQRFLHDEPLQIKLLARVDIWASALKGIADHPFAGIGPGTLNQVLPARYPYGEVGIGYTVTQAHNIVLDTALTMGIVGAVGVVCAVAGGMWWGFRQARVAAPSGVHAYAADTHAARVQATCAHAFTAPLVTFTVFGVTDALSFASPAGLVFWMSLAGLLRVTRASSDADTPR